MTAIELVLRLQQHRMWVNANLMTVAASLSDQQRRALHAIGQGSIWKSLMHLYGAEYVWLEALIGNEDPLLPGDLPGMIPGNQQADNAIATFEELQQRWAALEERWMVYLSQLTPESLDDPIAKVTSLTGQRATTRRSDILLHLCTHGQYTTAQVMNMLRHEGVTPLPDVMLIALARRDNQNVPS